VLRLFDLYRTASAPAAIALLIASNFLPLLGVLFWGWNLWSILILYWIENGIVGALNVPKMLLARGNGGTGGSGARVLMTAFFSIHYGLFWFVHGIFVWLVLPLFAGFFAFSEPVGAGGASFGAGESLAFSGVRGDVLQWGTIALLASHVASFLLNYIGRREYLTRSIGAQMSAPYARVVILHVTILLGAYAAALIGQPIGALMILVGLKTLLDLWLHLREHDPRPARTRIEEAGRPPT
jgi:uncharacterized protein DUF6498